MKSSETGLALPVGTVTLVLADTEGSSRLWERGPDEMRTATARLDSIVDEAVGAHDGVRPVEQGEGDSFVAGFSRASDAAESTLEILRTLSSESSPIALRVGIHTGEVQTREGVYVGVEVNRCARLRDVAHGGQIVLSRATHDLVVDHLPKGATLRDLGSHRLRDLARPEQIFQLCHPDLSSEFPPLRSLDAMPNNLPVQLTSFVGRRAEMGEVRRLLEETRVLTLTGAGGCGKTRLALHVAADILDAFPDGVWLVDLARISDADLVPQTVATTLGYKQEQGRSFTESLVAHLAKSQTLLLLDNCEHVVETVASLTESLLTGCPAVTVLATSRELLGVPSEVTWMVPSLSVPDERSPARIETVSQYEAVQLFIERATRTRPSFQVTNDNAPAVAQICHRLGGIPLAIELAAARSRVLTPQQISDGLIKRFELLAGGARTVVPRHQTLRASMDWSYELLSEEERILLRRLSVFAGGFTLEAAEEVFGESLLDLLTQLVDRSLVVMTESGEAARYNLLETVRQYGAERLLDAGESGEIRDRHLSYFIRFAEEAEPNLTRSEQDTWLARLDVEHGNLRAAFDWAQEHDYPESMLRLAGAVWVFWMERGHFGEGRRRLLAAAEHGMETSPTLRARALIGAAHMEEFLAENLEWGTHASQALERAGDDVALKGYSLERLGFLTQYLDLDAGLAQLDEGEAFAREVGDDLLLAEVLRSKGLALIIHGLPGLARPPLEEAIAVARRWGNRYLQRRAEVWLALTVLRTGDMRTAEPLLEVLLAGCREAGDDFWLGHALGFLAIARASTGSYESARTCAEECLAIADETGNPLVRIWALASAALLAEAEGDSAAPERCRELLESARKTSPIFFVFLPWLARAEIDHGLSDAARANLEEAMPYLRNGTWGIFLADALVAQGRLEGDEDLLHEAITLAVEQGSPLVVSIALDRIAGLAASNESYAEAARLLGAAGAERERLGLVPFAADRTANEATESAARQGLGDEAFQQAWDEGKAMSLEEAVAYARRGRGERKRPSTGWASLTPTEVEVVKLVAKGMTNPQIAERLFIARGTVRGHLLHVFAKLGIKTRAELAAEATRRGL